MGPKVQQGPCPWLGRVKVWHKQTKQNKYTYIKVRSEFEFELNGFKIPFDIFELKFKIELFEFNMNMNMNLIVFKLHSTSFTIFIQMELNF
jgi:hypothetical protein